MKKLRFKKISKVEMEAIISALYLINNSDEMEPLYIDNTFYDTRYEFMKVIFCNFGIGIPEWQEEMEEWVKELKGE